MYDSVTCVVCTCICVWGHKVRVDHKHVNKQADETMWCVFVPVCCVRVRAALAPTRALRAWVRCASALVHCCWLTRCAPWVVCPCLLMPGASTASTRGHRSASQVHQVGNRGGGKGVGLLGFGVDLNGGRIPSGAGLCTWEAGKSRERAECVCKPWGNQATRMVAGEGGPEVVRGRQGWLWCWWWSVSRVGGMGALSARGGGY